MNNSVFKRSTLAVMVVSSLAVSGCSQHVATTTPTAATKTVTVDDARQFVEQTEKELTALYLEGSNAEWIYQNFITDDTAKLSASVNEKITAKTVELAGQAARFDDLSLPYDLRRKLNKLKLALVVPSPANAEKNAELATIMAELGGTYGKGKYTTADGKTLSLPAMNEIMANSRDPQELLDIWQGWRQVSPPMRPQYQRQVELANEGARELGFNDLGTMWRSKYDMPAEGFATELDRLWGQVKPLYDALHCHVRAKLGDQYGTELVPADQPIPAHLLGNMWAQSWGNVYDLAAPQNADPGYNVTELLAKHNYDEIKMVKQSENFFSSLGFEPLPDTFWQRSLFTKPRDRDVVCHASAWDLDGQDDIRIKMCIQKTGEEFVTIHHELGHNYYQRAYKGQTVSYQESANDGFHEAIGDTVALSITPKYLKEIGLLDEIPSQDKDIGLLLRQAMDKVAFLPFALLVDQWRWKVFSGEITPDQYNQAWWDLREKYQGVRAPINRSENDFDPGAKYHIPGNTPYTRYFLAHILQFQFHKALCETAGDKGPVHRCSIYNSKEAGQQLNQMLEMGSSRPWPEALKVVTGTEQMDATPFLDYFAPLKSWLDQQNQGRQCGW